jgi:hypothetical protein
VSERIQVSDAERLAYLHQVKEQRIAEVAEARRALGRAETAMSEVVLDVMQLENQMWREGTLCEPTG